MTGKKIVKKTKSAKKIVGEKKKIPPGDKYMRLRHYIFPENHSKPFYCVATGFNRKLQKGLTFVEVNDPSSFFTKIKKLEPVSHTDEIDSGKHHNEVYERYYAKVREPTPVDPKEHQFETEHTMLLTFIFKKDPPRTMIVPTADVTLVDDADRNETQIIIGIAPPEDVASKITADNLSEVHVDLTNDPTPNFAGSVVSLGYYCMRFTIVDPKEVLSTKPISILTNLGNTKVYLNRPLKRTI